MNRPRALGTMAESAVVAFLRANGFLQAERRSLKGSLDQGDVTGTPGLCWEVKYGNGGIRMGAWVAQTEIERLNAGADFGILVIKPRGLGARSTGRWYAVMSVPSFDQMVGKIETKGWYMVGDPTRYTAGSLIPQLELARRATANSGMPFAITVVPPGAIGQPASHYRVMYLEEALRLVRAAGYGDPLE